MAQTGYTPISIYYSSTAGNTPTAGNLVAGELAINTADGKLFYKDSAGVVQVIAGKGGAGVAGGSNTQVQYNSSGSLAGSANFTFNGTTVTIANDASISGLTVGKGGGAQGSNTAIGSGAVSSNTTGVGNTGVGGSALAGNLTGNLNTAVGYNSLISAGGDNNSAFGSTALQNNTGSNNTAVGRGAATTNTSGSYNVAVGVSALQSNTTASNNTAVGYQAGYSNTTGANSAVIGYQAGYSTTTANSNSLLGFQAGYSCTTTGGNTYIGWQAGYAANGGYFNTFLGYGSGSAVTSGGKNTIVGLYSGNQGGLDIRTANNYIVLSDGDGNPRGIFDSVGSLRIGTAADNDTRTAIYWTQGAPTWGAKYLANNSGSTNFIEFRVNMGTTPTTVGSITYNGTTTLYNATSDQRLKENIVDAGSGLSKLAEIKIRAYDWIANKEHTDFGVIAQELVNIAPEAVLQGDDEEIVKDTWQVDTSVLIPAMIKAIQELKAEVDSLKQQLGK